MNWFKRNFVICCYVVFSSLIVKGYKHSFLDKPKDGFWDMKGALLVHPFPDKIDSLSGQQIFELQDEYGLTIWFGRHIFKDVCISGKCKMIRLWLFWDSAGNYLGMQVPEEEPLTKSDHTPFEQEDYEKLESILRDTTSILKDLKQKDLIIVPDTIDPYKAYEIDGYTAATQPSLSDIVVKDAVYTCHTLWHTAYGSTQKALFEIQNEKINCNYLKKIFESQNSSNNLLAIRSVNKFQEFHTYFYPEIIQLLKSEKSLLSEIALNYFQPKSMQEYSVIKDLIEILPEIEPINQNKIIWKLSNLTKIEANEVLKLLKLIEKNEIGIGNLNLIYQFISREDIMENCEIYQILKKFLVHENSYVRSLTQKLLNK